MRSTHLAVLAIVIACAGASDPNDGAQPAWRELGDATTRVQYQDTDAGLAAALLEHAQAGRSNASTFLGESFASGVTMRIYPDRASLTEYWRSAWNQPSLVPECWMVASATRSIAVALSPRVWSQSACGHNASDPSYVRRIISHEIVHVLHGQLNPLPEVNAVASLKWLTEGLAFYAAGQLDDAARSQLRGLIAGGYTPASLESVLAGQGGYGAAASIMAYIDARFGRAAVRSLTRARSTAEALTLLGVSEAALLQAWRDSAR